MRYVGKVYRPPSEADAYLLQATIGCSWNKCTYCDMYRDKPKFQIRDIKEVLEDLHMSAQQAGNRIQKLFVTDGDIRVRKHRPVDRVVIVRVRQEDVRHILWRQAALR